MQRCNGSGCLWKTDILYCPITLSIMCDWLSNPWYTWMNVAYVITQITFSPACLTAIKNKIFNIWFLINISVFSSHPLKANLSTCLGICTVKPRRPLYFFTTADERNAGIKLQKVVKQSQAWRTRHDFRTVLLWLDETWSTKQPTDSQQILIPVLPISG